MWFVSATRSTNKQKVNQWRMIPRLPLESDGRCYGMRPLPLELSPPLLKGVVQRSRNKDTKYCGNVNPPDTGNPQKRQKLHLWMGKLSKNCPSRVRARRVVVESSSLCHPENSSAQRRRLRMTGFTPCNPKTPLTAVMSEKPLAATAITIGVLLYAMPPYAPAPSLAAIAARRFSIVSDRRHRTLNPPQQ